MLHVHRASALCGPSRLELGSYRDHWRFSGNPISPSIGELAGLKISIAMGQVGIVLETER